MPTLASEGVARWSAGTLAAGLVHGPRRRLPGLLSLCLQQCAARTVAVGVLCVGHAAHTHESHTSC